MRDSQRPNTPAYKPRQFMPEGHGSERERASDRVREVDRAIHQQGCWAEGLNVRPWWRVLLNVQFPKGVGVIDESGAR